MALADSHLHCGWLWLWWNGPRERWWNGSGHRDGGLVVCFIRVIVVADGGGSHSQTAYPPSLCSADCVVSAEFEGGCYEILLGVPVEVHPEM